jgi:hypothetical protein
MFRKPLGPRALRAVAELLRGAPDEEIRRPLWAFLPEEVPLVIHERRRRFGWDDGDFDPEYH